MSVDNLKVALVQMQAIDDKEANIRRAEQLFYQAAEQKARLVLFPECFCFRGKASPGYLSKYVAESVKGPTVRRFQSMAKATKVNLVLGSIYEVAPGKKKFYNTSVFIDEKGRTLGYYRKKNLFSANIQKGRICESDVFLPGKQLKTFLIDGFCFGASICYDLRFPEMFRYYARKGCDVIVAPSNFTYETGKDHWEILVRARAIENKCYVLAPNQCGKDTKGIRAYGKSMAVDPWGEILACSDSDKDGILFSTVKKREILKTRKRLG